MTKKFALLASATAMKHEASFLSALMFGFVAASGAMAQEQPPPTVVLGTDYFQTVPGTYDTIPGLGVVNFQGVPIGPGLTDTIIERTSDIVINAPPPESPNLLMTALSLRSTAPVDIGPSDPFIYATLNPDVASTGTMAINGSLAGGTFDATLNVFFDICLAPGAHGVGCAAGGGPIGTGELVLTDTNSPWGPTPPTGAVIVTGLVGDQAANMHLDLAEWQTDFWPIPASCGPTACHPVTPALVPEPSTWLMLLAGFGGLGAAAMRRRGFRWA